MLCTYLYPSGIIEFNYNPYSRDFSMFSKRQKPLLTRSITSLKSVWKLAYKRSLVYSACSASKRLPNSRIKHLPTFFTKVRIAKISQTLPSLTYTSSMSLAVLLMIPLA